MSYLGVGREPQVRRRTPLRSLKRNLGRPTDGPAPPWPGGLSDRYGDRVDVWRDRQSLGSCCRRRVLGIAVIVSALQGSLTWSNMVDAAFGAIRTISMIGLIVAGAFFLSVSMGYLGVPRIVAAEIAALELSPLVLILLLLVFYVILGMVLEGMSSIVMTLPITLPLILDAGFDKIWFGIFLVIVVEMAQITPPVGFNLFVIQGMTGEKIGRIARATFPFFLIMVLLVIAITLFPQIVMYLPGVIEFRG